MKALLLIVSIPTIIAFLLWLEKTLPIEKDQPRTETICNYKMVAINIILNQLLKPATSLCAAAIVNAMGGGFIELRTDGWWSVLSLIVFILSMEFYSYFIHRLQHTVPALWAMHSLHHSAGSLTLVVGARHYWFEGVAMVGFLPLLDVVFKIPVDLLFDSPRAQGQEFLQAPTAYRCDLWYSLETGGGRVSADRFDTKRKANHADRWFSLAIP